MQPLMVGLLPDGRRDLASYRAGGGYRAWPAAGSDLDQLRRRLSATALTGLGGAHFPFAAKFTAALAAPGPRVLVCNGAEDEPGSSKDRTLLQLNPHAVIEGTLLAASALEADQIFCYVSESSEKAVDSLGQAVDEARAGGLVPAGVALTVRLAPADYVAGEASAAIRALEGADPLPVLQPPYPTERGYRGRPTLVSNCETLANLPRIVAASPGEQPDYTRLVTVSGDVCSPGVFEVVPTTTTFGELIDLAGGLRGQQSELKAIQPGGPSSAYLPATATEVLVSDDAIRAAGSSPGCLAVRVLSSDACIVDDLARTTRFFARAQCGQCPPCRMKTHTYSNLMTKLRQGAGGWDLLDRFSVVDAFVADLPRRCALIDMPTAAVHSAIRLFRDDFAAHLDGAGCPRCQPAGSAGSTQQADHQQHKAQITDRSGQ